MMKRTMASLMLTLTLSSGWLLAPLPAWAEDQAKAAAQKDEAPTLAGQILGVSKKAKTISIKVGDNTEMVKYTDATKGVEFAEKGESAIILFATQDGEKVATEVKQKLAKVPEGTSEIQPEEVAALIKAAGDAYTLIDSRPGKRFAEAAIPTAISVPIDSLKEKGAALLPQDKERTLIFYCGGPTCGLSPESASIAVKAGYKNVKVMIKGLPGWKKAGNLAVASMDFVKKGNNVILDLRPADEAAKGFIPRAVHAPFASFAELKDKLPTVKSAPFVVYGSEEDCRKAVKQLAEWGFKTASVINGGLDGWLKAGGELSTGAPATDIAYTREMEKGEVGIDEFKKALAGSADAIILDVRTKEEMGEGIFAGSVSIPLDQLEKRMAELAKDKEILIHCTTGDRAAMAADQLKKAGYKARYLVAAIECEDGKCSIAD